MRKFILTLGSLTLVLVLVHLLLFFAQLGVETEKSRWIQEALTLKESRARAIESPKILIIAGSNALYSFSAEQIEARLGIPTVNCGIHAGLRLEYILRRYEGLVGKGDIVVLPLEYSAYDYDGETSETLADFVSARDPDWVRESPFVFINTAFCFSIIELADRNIRRFRPDARRIGHYDASYISAHGDKTNTARELITKGHRDEIIAAKPLKVRAFSENSKAAKILSAFIKRCQTRGATVLFTCPVTIGFDDYKHVGFRESIAARVSYFTGQGANWLGGPDDFFLPKDFFFNTVYHANADGRTLATSRLIELLETYLASAHEPGVRR